jgi:phosphomevalonate kinase
MGHQERGEQFNRLINVISQVANLSAQKKVGSNFDISTAVFGTHLYKNILPHRIMEHSSSQAGMLQSLLKIDPQITVV